jgi:hypothetical protein
MNRFAILIAVGLSLLLQACGGGGGDSSGGSTITTYSGLMTEARIDTGNSQDLSTAVASGAMQSVVADSAEGALLPRSVPNPESKLVEISPKIAQWITQSGVLYSAKTTNYSAYICDSGGSAVADTNDAETVGTIVFLNCGISDGASGTIVITGSVDFSITLSGGSADSMSMTFRVTVAYGGESANINMTISCVNLTGVASCTVSSDFVGLDNRVYRVTDITVSGNASSGYYVSATVYDPAHGRVGMTTTAPLLYNCSNGVPSTGTVVISGTDSTSATINFVSCSEFNVTVAGGSSETFFW